MNNAHWNEYYEDEKILKCHSGNKIAFNDLSLVYSLDYEWVFKKIISFGNIHSAVNEYKEEKKSLELV